MRVQLLGTYKLNDIEDVFRQIIEELRQNSVETMAGVNLYFKPCRDGESIALHDANGVEIEHVSYNFSIPTPYEPKSENISVVNSGRGSSNYYPRQKFQNDIRINREEE